MYTEESMDYNDSVYVEEENNNFPWKKLLIRVLIIFVCLLLAIWLISKIVGGKSKNDGTVFNNNLDTIRLASEKYFFIENNLPVENEDSLTITLIEMNNKGLVETVRDYKENACSTNGSESYSTLKKTSIAYELTIKLTCKEEQKEITYYYDLADYKCLSCSGNTYMDGSLVLDSETDEEDNDENSNENNNEENNEVTYQKHIVTKGDTLNKIANLYNTTVSEIKKLNNLTSDNIYVGQTLLIPNSSNGGTVNISCDKWSDWTTIKLTDSNLAVRTRTLIKGYKNEGVTPVYGQWSEWTKTPITGSDTLQVETKTENEQSWSGNKTTTSYISNSSTIKVVDTSTSGGKKTCKTVYSNVRADLKPSTYTSYNSKGLIVTLHKVYNKRVTSNGTTKYTLMYDATYKKASEKCTTSSGVTTYTYQELVNKEVTYYRSRTITNEPNKDNTVYTDYVETLPEGYTKVDGSDLVQYSYKETICK